MYQPTTTPTLYILCGLPFSGKTTLTNKIAEMLGFATVHVDDIVFAYGYNWTDNNKILDSEWQKIFDDSYKKTLLFLKSGISVVYDWANQEKSKRDMLRNIAGNFPTKVIHVDTPMAVIKKRWEENKITKARFDISESVLCNAIDTYRPPLQNEHVMTYTPEVDIDTWILKNFSKMNY